MEKLESEIINETNKLRINYLKLVGESFGVFLALFGIVEFLNYFHFYSSNKPIIAGIIFFISLSFFVLSILYKKISAYKKIQELAFLLINEFNIVSNKHKAIVSEYGKISESHVQLRETFAANEKQMDLLKYIANQHLMVLSKLNLQDEFEENIKKIKQMLGGK